MSGWIPRLDLAPPRSDTVPGDIGQQWFDTAGRLVASGGRANGRWWMHWQGLATYWFGQRGHVVAEPISTAIAPQVEDAFTRVVTPVVLLARGFEALHASAFLHSSGVIAFCGPSGTGKSTLAHAVASQGPCQFADDTVAYRLHRGQPRAVALPFPVRLDAEARRAMAASHVALRGRPPQFTSFPLSRIYDLVRDTRVDARSPVFSRLAAADSFERLLAHAHAFEMGPPDRARQFIETNLQLARCVEIWECRFAPDLRALPTLAATVQEHVSMG